MTSVNKAIIDGAKAILRTELDSDLSMKEYVQSYNAMASIVEGTKEVKKFPTKAKAVERVKALAEKVVDLNPETETPVEEIVKPEEKIENLEDKEPLKEDKEGDKEPVVETPPKKKATGNLVKIGDKVHKLQHSLSTKLFADVTEVTVKVSPEKGYFNLAWFEKRKIELKIDDSLEM